MNQESWLSFGNLIGSSGLTSIDNRTDYAGNQDYPYNGVPYWYSFIGMGGYGGSTSNPSRGSAPRTGSDFGGGGGGGRAVLNNTNPILKLGAPGGIGVVVVISEA